MSAVVAMFILLFDDEYWFLILYKNDCPTNSHPFEYLIIGLQK
jgi:hypothetical protein